MTDETPLTPLQTRFVRAMHQAGLPPTLLAQQLRLPISQVETLCGLPPSAPEPEPPSPAAQPASAPPEPPHVVSNGAKEDSPLPGADLDKQATSPAPADILPSTTPTPPPGVTARST
jgi:hypothetical protein